MPTLDMIQQAVHQAVAEYPVKLVELFGSYANGTADADSDVDFLVEFAENPTSLVQICGLRETLSELLHLEVDIVKLPRRPDDGMTIERTVPMYGARYEIIDFDDVQKTIRDDIPILKAALEAMEE